MPKSSSMNVKVKNNCFTRFGLEKNQNLLSAMKMCTVVTKRGNVGFLGHFPS